MSRVPRKSKNPEFLKFRPYRAFTGATQETQGRSAIWKILFVSLAITLAVGLVLGWSYFQH